MCGGDLYIFVADEQQHAKQPERGTLSDGKPLRPLSILYFLSFSTLYYQINANSVLFQVLTQY